MGKPVKNYESGCCIHRKDLNTGNNGCYLFANFFIPFFLLAIKLSTEKISFKGFIQVSHFGMLFFMEEF